jgi:hypothetical protein
VELRYEWFRNWQHYATLRRRSGSRVVTAEQLLGVMNGVDARLAVVAMRRWDPFGVAVGAFSGGPAAGFDQPMVGTAGERDIVQAGGLACRVLVDVVAFAEIAGYVAARR